MTPIVFNNKIKFIIENTYPKPNEISLCIIDIHTGEKYGYNEELFIYPASIYKTFIAAEILRKVDVGELKIDQIIAVDINNEINHDYKLFPLNAKQDHRPLLKSGDRVTIDYLLDLVFSRSDNTASNILVDLATREAVNENIILANCWQGSEVARKFLDRRKENEKYQHSKITVSCGKHLAEFFYKVEKGELINKRVSRMLKNYMAKRNSGNRPSLKLPIFKEYYGKGGWLEINPYKMNLLKAFKNVWQKGYAINRWCNDAAIIRGEKSHYAIAVLTLKKSKCPWINFPIQKFSRQIYELMEGGV